MDHSWTFEGGSALTEFRIVNNTDEERLIKLKLSVERYTSGTFNSGYAFLGAVEREYEVGPESSEAFSERFEFLKNVSGPNLAVSIEILSNQVGDEMPARVGRSK